MIKKPLLMAVLGCFLFAACEKDDTGPQGIKGDTGAVGATGAAGTQGPKGDTGATGATGPQGVKGDTGNSGVSSITFLKYTFPESAMQLDSSEYITATGKAAYTYQLLGKANLTIPDYQTILATGGVFVYVRKSNVADAAWEFESSEQYNYDDKGLPLSDPKAATAFLGYYYGKARSAAVEISYYTSGLPGIVSRPDGGMINRVRTNSPVDVRVLLFSATAKMGMQKQHIDMRNYSKVSQTLGLKN